MPNLFSDNKDLQFQFTQLDLRDVVDILENHYQDAQHYDGAPANYEEAVEMYEAALELVGDITGNFIAPRATQVDLDGPKFNNGQVAYAEGTRENLDLLSKSDLMGVIIPRRFGGMNFPATIYMMMIEIISRADASLMTLFGYQDVGEAIAKYGTEAQGQEFLPKYCRGEETGAMVLTEPHGGSDLQTVKVTAHEDEDGNWRLNGVKRFISNGCGNILLVLARSEAGSDNIFGLSLFVCRRDESVTISRIEEKLGLHGSPTCELIFEDTPAQLVGKRRFGLMKYVLDILNHARFSVASQGLGIAEAAYEEALGWAKERVAFGSPVYEKPQVANMLMNMRVAIESSRSLLYHSVQWLDLRNKLEEYIEELKAEKKDVPADLKKRFDRAARVVDMLSPMVKYTVTEAANRVCYDAVQIHGGQGYMRESVVERLYRDVRITNIYEGTSQVQIIGASKGVMSDLLADFFAGKAEKDYPPELAELAIYQKELRATFIDCLDRVKLSDDAKFKDVAIKDLVDMYCNLFVGYLLLDEAEEVDRKKKIAARFILNSLSASRQSLAAITNNQYGDLESRKEICEHV